MPTKDFEPTVISKPGAAVKEFKIELPDYLSTAIADSLERGKQAAREHTESASDTAVFPGRFTAKIWSSWFKKKG